MSNYSDSLDNNEQDNKIRVSLGTKVGYKYKIKVKYWVLNTNDINLKDNKFHKTKK